MVSPALVALTGDALVVDFSVEMTVELDVHPAPSGLDDLDLGEQSEAEAAMTGGRRLRRSTSALGREDRGPRRPVPISFCPEESIQHHR